MSRDAMAAGGAWLTVGAGVACVCCGRAAAVTAAEGPRCWPCLAEGLARDLAEAQAERERLAGLVASHEGVLRCLEAAVGAEREALATGRRPEDVLAARGVAVRPWR